MGISDGLSQRLIEASLRFTPRGFLGAGFLDGRLGMRMVRMAAAEPMGARVHSKKFKSKPDGPTASEVTGRLPSLSWRSLSCNCTVDLDRVRISIAVSVGFYPF